MAVGGRSNTDDVLLETLNLPEHQTTDTTTISSQRSAVTCLLCPLTFNIDDDKNPLLKHLLDEHKLVIADVNLIGDLGGYIRYWQVRFSQQPIKEFCSVIRTNCKPEDPGEQEDFYLLSDTLTEDKELREYLQRKRLDFILHQLQKERDDVTFKRRCLFCRDKFEGNRSMLLDHLSHDHSFAIGRSDNLVFVNEFLDKLQEKLEKLQCLYCEKTFRDWTTLKDHMRKKQHKKVNPKNKEYDKFYIINYLEMGKNWETVRAEDDRDLAQTESDDPDNWADWNEDTTANIVCLFCSHNSSEMPIMLNHLTETHNFDLCVIKKTLGLNFYQQIKLINFIRREIHQNKCFSCQEKYPSKDELYEHMTKEQHISKMPDRKVWDQPQYFFPTYENDTLLCALEDDDDSDVNKGSTIVLAEDIPHEDSILDDRVLVQNLVS
ncbi:zinc finger protein 277-like isoform X2 [Anneissia japonica]|nr:zinc finger protein 277-like isoform X2 [Anneissia japonica]XP_033100481.1 zinc finger protein 277-like isoform X2 [Anneissia japonica]XP_033100482.1 zinc finger protein 277-like isoform X2 [Anneissia japonica]